MMPDSSDEASSTPIEPLPAETIPWWWAERVVVIAWTAALLLIAGNFFFVVRMRHDEGLDILLVVFPALWVFVGLLLPVTFLFSGLRFDVRRMALICSALLILLSVAGVLLNLLYALLIVSVYSA